MPAEKVANRYDVKIHELRNYIVSKEGNLSNSPDAKIGKIRHKWRK